MTDYNEVEVKTELTAQGGVEETQETVTEKSIKPIEGKVTKKKRGLLERLVTNFIGPDGIQDVTTYVGHEIIAPAIKNVVADAIKGGVDGLLYGRDGVGRGYSAGPQNYGHNQRTNYSGRSSYARNARQDNRRDYGPQDDTRGTAGRSRRPRFNSESYIIENRDEAMYVLHEMQNNAEDFGFVSLADFYELIGETSEYTDNNWGWMAADLRGASVRSSRNGFVVILPPVTNL